MPPPSPIYDFEEDPDTGIWSWDGGILEEFFRDNIVWKEIT